MIQPYGSIDPERITSKNFGGPYFILGYTDGKYFYSMCKNKRWSLKDVDRAWEEGRNSVPELLVVDK